MTAGFHPRLSLNALVTPSWSFEQDIDFWKRIGLRCVGLTQHKLKAFGHDRAIDELKKAGMRVSCVVAGPLTLLDSSLWEAERDDFHRCIDVAQALGGTVYGPPGKGVFDDFDANVAIYARAIAPSIEYGRAAGVDVSFEPTLRPYLSFVHTLRDSLDLAERSGAKLIVDIGNCYSERDVRGWIAKVIPHTGAVQISDVAVGTLADPGACVRTLPGKGDLPLGEFLKAAVGAGYAGPFEVEFLGDRDVDEEAIVASLRVTDGLIRNALNESG